MSYDKVFPTILIVLDIGAAITYATNLNWRMTVYWLAAAILTICVTL